MVSLTWRSLLLCAIFESLGRLLVVLVVPGSKLHEAGLSAKYILQMYTTNYLHLLRTMPARGDHSLRPSARVRGLNFCGRALKVLSTQSAIASACSASSDGMVISRASVAYYRIYASTLPYSHGYSGVDLMLRVEKPGPSR